MSLPEKRILHIASAILDDGNGRLLLVRKTGTPWFMQAGGKIEPSESAVQALCRELNEELGLNISETQPEPLGTFTAIAANEAETIIEAALFFLRIPASVTVAAEIDTALWLTPDEAEAFPLAPLTRDHVLPIARERCRPHT
ncbi:NUDIX hydrolase [Neokomagataea anthophila]|uniref:NUDIX domain-containing protein n=1 Tax=Neokomagataea anthophila TaxID=2826925 RepID=A0ABS5E7Q1_9PROT|nr:NUDIX domain-containing protein [Neokomagataea anthophila]MBR0559927.1 NUDIX domain-containing protein [Neokomagataea anthophila]